MFETFAERKRKKALAGQPEIYSYDEASPQLKHPICMSILEGIGNFYIPQPYSTYSSPNANNTWIDIDRVCRKEIYSYLDFAGEDDLSTRFLKFLTYTGEIDDFLSGVEIACIALGALDKDTMQHRGAKMSGLNAIADINGRFEQHAIGYAFENGEVIRIDSKHTHAEIIKPALLLLQAPYFSKANDEFMTAHRHYRSSEYKDCITAANRSFEAALKAICDKQKWQYGSGDRASELITKVSTNGLFTHAFDKTMASYIAMMKSGLPVVRNDAGGHGESLAAAAVTPEIARFALNMTASNLVFLGESYKRMTKS